ncbi:hypothetical protein SAMN05216378_5458 [Paenibacillus catalpae]|uniref:Uncharacterized protein n=1 Tax=Paenibacillus catalpae TaxID=1045775 RepID=A0A1I2GUC9_9BACL|nr:hypothetical protein SAMN05216378_5458 [Paenibacillus catalpae]
MKMNKSHDHGIMAFSTRREYWFRYTWLIFSPAKLMLLLLR